MSCNCQIFKLQTEQNNAVLPQKWKVWINNFQGKCLEPFDFVDWKFQNESNASSINTRQIFMKKNPVMVKDQSSSCTESDIKKIFCSNRNKLNNTNSVNSKIRINQSIGNISNSTLTLADERESLINVNSMYTYKSVDNLDLNSSFNDSLSQEEFVTSFSSYPVGGNNHHPQDTLSIYSEKVNSTMNNDIQFNKPIKSTAFFQLEFTYKYPVTDETNTESYRSLQSLSKSKKPLEPKLLGNMLSVNCTNIYSNKEEIQPNVSSNGDVPSLKSDLKADNNYDNQDDYNCSSILVDISCISEPLSPANHEQSRIEINERINNITVPTCEHKLHDLYETKKYKQSGTLFVGQGRMYEVNSLNMKNNNLETSSIQLNDTQEPMSLETSTIRPDLYSVGLFDPHDKTSVNKIFQINQFNASVPLESHVKTNNNDTEIPFQSNVEIPNSNNSSSIIEDKVSSSEDHNYLMLSENKHPIETSSNANLRTNLSSSPQDLDVTLKCWAYSSTDMKDILISEMEADDMSKLKKNRTHSSQNASSNKLTSLNNEDVNQNAENISNIIPPIGDSNNIELSINKWLNTDTKITTMPEYHPNFLNTPQSDNQNKYDSLNENLKSSKNIYKNFTSKESKTPNCCRAVSDFHLNEIKDEKESKNCKVENSMSRFLIKENNIPQIPPKCWAKNINITRNVETLKKTITRTLSFVNEVSKCFTIWDVDLVKLSLVQPIEDRRLVNILNRHKCRARIVQAKATRSQLRYSTIQVTAPSRNQMSWMARDVDKVLPKWNLRGQLSKLYV